MCVQNLKFIVLPVPEIIAVEDFLFTMGVGGWLLAYEERRLLIVCAISFQDFQPMWS